MKAYLESQKVLLIDPARWQSHLRAIENDLPVFAFYTPGEMEPAEDDVLLPIDGDGIATIDVCGVIASGLPEYADQFGFCRTEDVSSAIMEAATNPSVKAILLHIDSPGGFVTGTPECANAIEQAAAIKPLYAYTEGQCCSAAYWLAAPARAIIATPSSDVGSIGVYTAFEDLSAMAQMMGIAVRVFRSGKFKGAGVPGTSLSEDQAANMQGQVDSLAAIFKAQVTQHRPGVSEESMQGQSFMGYAAAPLGLVDALAMNETEAKKILLQDLT